MKCYLLFIFCPLLGYSQQWNLNQCIDTALENNLSVKTSEIAGKIAAYQLRGSKTNLLPSVNGNATHGYNWGQTIDLFTNQFASNRVMYDNFYLSSSVVLFSGLQNYYLIKANTLGVQETTLDKEIRERNVKIDVASAFFQVLLNKEIVELATQNIGKSTVQMERIQELIKEKQATQFDLSEIEAQLQSDKYYQIKAQNDLAYSKLLLQQVLNTEIKADFDVLNSLPDYKTMAYDDTMISKLPELLKIELSAQRQIYLLKSAKGRYYPTLSLGGSLGSGYSENNTLLSGNGTLVPKPFREQINDNFYQSAFITLSVPVFNKNASRTQIRIKELELESLYIDRQNEYQIMKQKLEQLALEIVNTTNQVEALEKVYQSAQLNYDNFQIRYENGDVSFTQLIENRNKWMLAESELLQATYQLLFKQTVLGFYY